MREWTIDESRLIAERVMEWQVFEFRGRLWLRNFDDRPRWMTSSKVPDWPHDPAAAAMVLAAIQMDGWRVEGFWTAASHTFCVRLWNPVSHATAYGNSREWSEAIMMAVLAAVDG